MEYFKSNHINNINYGYYAGNDKITSKEHSNNMKFSQNLRNSSNNLIISQESNKLERFSKILQKYKVKNTNYNKEINEYISQEKKKIIIKGINKQSNKNNIKLPLISNISTFKKKIVNNENIKNDSVTPLETQKNQSLSKQIKDANENLTNLQSKLHRLKLSQKLESRSQTPIKERINLSNEKSITFRSKSPIAEKIKIVKQPIYKYFIGKDNNGILVKNHFLNKENWEETVHKDSNYINFHWEDVSQKINFRKLEENYNMNKLVNHFEGHSCLSNKMNLFTNVLKYCEKNELNVFTFMPFTVVLTHNSHAYHDQLKSLQYIYENINSFISKTTNDNPPRYRLYTQLFSIGFKYDMIGSKTEIKIPASHFQSKNYWLVKAVNLNRGRGIKICDNYTTILNCVKKFNSGICLNFKESEQYDTDIYNKELEENAKSSPKSKLYKSQTTIIQKYIENPFLFNGRKFDIRLWVLVTNQLEVYLFKEGHLKLSSEAYDINNVNSYVHLTNFSVQKYNPAFSQQEIGNELSFQAFQTYLDENYSILNYSVKDNLITEIKKIIRITMKAVKNKLSLRNKNSCYEIFGYDFILDCNLTPFLLEVNTNPGFEESSPICDELVPRMIEDSLKLTVDRIFNDGDNTTKAMKEIIKESDCNIISRQPARNKVKGYSDYTVMYDSICNL